MTTGTSGSFDAAGYYEFDLASGKVADRSGDRVVMLTEDALGPLVRAAAGSGDLTAMRELGTTLGGRVRSAMGDVSAATPSEVFSAAAGHLAVFGWGTLSVERWGDALCFALEGAPSHDEHGLAISALLGGLMSTLTDHDVACVPCAGDRFLLVDAEIAEEVWGWAQEADGVGALVARLAPGGAS